MNDAYQDALTRWPLTPEAVEAGAKALALALCGGDWSQDYTEEQREHWRSRVDGAASMAFQIADLTARLDESRRCVETERAKVLDLNGQLHEATTQRVVWQSRWETTDRALGEHIEALSKASVRVAELDEQVHPKGSWYCDKCKFHLKQMVMSASTGAVAPQHKDGGDCPNCHTPLRRMTWRDEAEQMLELAEAIQARETQAVKALSDLQSALLPGGTPEPLAVAYGFDGHGWQYIDAGSGSDWHKRGLLQPDAVRVYTEADMLKALSSYRFRLMAMAAWAGDLCEALDDKGVEFDPEDHRDALITDLLDTYANAGVNGVAERYHPKAVAQAPETPQKSH